MLPVMVNLTPHQINYYISDEKVGYILESKGIARVKASTTPVEGIDEDGFFIFVKTVYGEVEGLPEERPGVYHIVSGIVKAACPERHDLVVPTDFVRDNKGNIVGCKAFSI